MKPLQKKYWRHVAVLVACIYLSLPIARPLSEFLRKHIPFRLTIDLIAIVLVVSCIYVFYKKVALRKPSTYFFIMVLISVYTYFWAMMKIPEERIHLIEYSFLAYLIFRAFRLDLAERPCYFSTLFLTSLFGWLDEGIQYLLPGRFYDLRDVGFNILGGLLGVLITLIVRRELSWKKGEKKTTHL